MASSTHHLPHTVRKSRGPTLHLHSGAAVFTGGDKFDNNVAAMPSSMPPIPC